MYLLVSRRLSLVPPWLLLAVVALLMVPITVSWRRGLHGITRKLALGTLGIVTLALVASAVFLVLELPDHNKALQPVTLLTDAALIWMANVLTFGIWYWEVDGGGPARRHHDRHCSKDFLFPQMASSDPELQQWTPRFVDYVFLAFNTSTALSPTDTQVLSRRAKVLMMAQASISLVVIVVLAARAINTL